VASIVFHVGMPKAASTTLQQWLGANVEWLRERGVRVMRILCDDATGKVSLVPARTKKVGSWFPADPATRVGALARICAALDDHHDDGDTILLTSESYSVLFDGFGRRDMLPHVDELGRRHRVRIAYYVRPQHAWLESGWAHWGLRHPVPPTTWIRWQQKRLAYATTLHDVRELAPHLSFEMRPFRADLLAGGQIVTDFARTFLAIDEPLGHVPASSLNRGLPLEVAILLRDAPAGWFWDGPQDNAKFYRLKRHVLQYEIPPTDVTRRSREVLRRYAHTRFEGGNRYLIGALGWATDHFVPGDEPLARTDPNDDAFDLVAELDELWTSNTNEAERRLVFCALRALVEGETTSATPREAVPSRSGVGSVLGFAERGARRAVRAVRARTRTVPSKVGSGGRDRAVERERPDAPEPRAARRSSATVEHPHVRDVAVEVGLDLLSRTYGAVVFDANGDGRPDIFLSRHDAAAYLYRNVGGRFVLDEAARFPGKVDRHCPAAGDVNGDGRLDLFCVIGGHSGHAAKERSAELWVQQEDGSFRDEGAECGVSDPYGRGREAVLFDATGNGCLDVLVGNVSPRSDGRPSPNRLFLNDGDGRFRPAPEMGLDLEYSVGGAGRPGSPHGGGNWPMGRLATLDADGDGWTDVVMCAQRPGDTVQRVHLFRNDGGTGFHDVTADTGLSTVEARDVAVVDLTGDGQPDLVVVNRAGVVVLLNDRGRFQVVHRVPVEHAFRVAVADADGDGRPDIYVMRTRNVPAPDVPDLLLVSEGGYDAYRTITLPTVDGEVRDDAVYPIDYDGDGRFEFLVLHGHSLHAAPVQLIKLR
jgi:hypothetical protein